MKNYQFKRYRLLSSDSKDMFDGAQPECIHRLERPSAEPVKVMLMSTSRSCQVNEGHHEQVIEWEMCETCLIGQEVKLNGSLWV